MRQGSERRNLRRRRDPGHASRSGPLDERSTAILDGGDGSNYVHRLDLQSSGATRTVKVAHPFMSRGIAAVKKKDDRIDVGKLADYLRCDFLRSATWPQARSENGGGRCVTAIC